MAARHLSGHAEIFRCSRWPTQTDGAWPVLRTFILGTIIHQLQGSAGWEAPQMTRAHSDEQQLRNVCRFYRKFAHRWLCTRFSCVLGNRRLIEWTRHTMMHHRIRFHLLYPVVHHMAKEISAEPHHTAKKQGLLGVLHCRPPARHAEIAPCSLLSVRARLLLFRDRHVFFCDNRQPTTALVKLVHDGTLHLVADARLELLRELVGQRRVPGPV